MAGRIPQSFINELLARVDIVDVIDRRITLKKTGKNYSACCPFHNEKTPSFSVSPDKQFYYCFGCGASGNALTFLMEYEGQEFVASIEDLAQTMGMEVPREAYAGSTQFSHESLYDLMRQATQFYQSQLKNNPSAKPAVSYLKNRGLSGEIAKKYAIGYAPEGWQNLEKLKTTSENLTQDLIDTGMMIKNDKGHTYDRFRDRIMFPIRNRRGQVIGFGGRIIDQGEPKYLNSPETKLFHKGRELYGLYEMRKEMRNIEQILVVEGYMDVVALAQFGFYNAAATLGTATSSEHLQTLFRICAKVILCFDGDRAGKAAAIRALEHGLPQLKDAREIRIMFLPDGEDPDSLVRKIGPEEFQEKIDQSSTLFDFLIQHLTSQVDMNTFEGPGQLIHLAKPFVKAIADPILKARFNAQLASLAGLNEKQLSQMLSNTIEQEQRQNSPNSNEKNSENSAHTAPSDQSQSAPSTRQPNEVKPIKIQGKAPFRKAIAILLQNPDAIPAANLDWISQIDDPGAIIFYRLCQLVADNEGISTGALIEHWRGFPEEKHLVRLANSELLISADKMAPELADILVRLEKETVIDQWDKLVSKSKLGPLTPSEKLTLKTLQKEMLRRG